MYIIGIETSCDETAAAVVSADEGGKLKLLSDAVASQVEMHRLWGGVVPELAGRAHIEAISHVTARALKEAGIGIGDVGCVAVTSFPGLIGALLVGVNFAKTLAYANNIPLVPVNHIYAHVAAVTLTEEPPDPPFIAFAVSGGHTSIYIVRSYTDFEEIGTTRDDAAGEAFDKVGRVIGMPYPAGAEMDRAACSGNPEAYAFPSPAIKDPSFDFSFSGLKTAALNLINSSRQKGIEADRCDIAASFTKAVCDGICGKVRNAVETTGIRKIVLAGGVSANSHLRAAMAEECARNGARLWVLPKQLCGDNGAMVAALGYYNFMAGMTADEFLNAYTD